MSSSSGGKTLTSIGRLSYDGTVHNYSNEEIEKKTGVHTMNYTECQLSFIISNWAEGSIKKCGNKKARKSRMEICYNM